MDADALFRLTNGLYVLGTYDGERMVGSLIDAVTQVAHDPCVMVISCNNQSYTKECIEKTKEFSLSVLGKDCDPFILANFGFQSSRDVNKWDNVQFHIKDNLPYLDKNIASIQCKVLSQKKFDSNTLFVAEILDASCGENAEPLTYRDYREYFKTEVLKSFEDFKNNKTTTQQASKEDIKMSNTGTTKWVCKVCGYVYDGDVPFEELPEDWVCPLCGVDKSFFEQRDE